MKRAWLVGIAVLLLVWTLVTATGLISRLFLPAPWATFEALFKLLATGGMWVDIFGTLFRTLGGFCIGAAVGIPVGLLMGRYRPIYNAMELPVDFFRSIPATALFPLFIVIFGLGNSVKVFTAAWASGMVVLINTIYGMRSVPEIRLMVAKLKRLSPARTFYRVIIPNALPYIIAGGRIGLSLALVVEIVAEMFLGASTGLGHRIFNATTVFDMEEAYATVFVVGLVGYLINKLILFIERRGVHWTGK